MYKKKFETTSGNLKQGKLNYIPMYENHSYEKLPTPNQPTKTHESCIMTCKYVQNKELNETLYREVVNSLFYSATIIRPDISFAMNYFTRQVCNPKFKHWKIVYFIT